MRSRGPCVSRRLARSVLAPQGLVLPFTARSAPAGARSSPTHAHYRYRRRRSRSPRRSRRGRRRQRRREVHPLRGVGNRDVRAPRAPERSVMEATGAERLRARLRRFRRRGRDERRPALPASLGFWRRGSSESLVPAGGCPRTCASACACVTSGCRTSRARGDVEEGSILARDATARVGRDGVRHRQRAGRGGRVSLVAATLFAEAKRSCASSRRRGRSGLITVLHRRDAALGPAADRRSRCPRRPRRS